MKRWQSVSGVKPGPTAPRDEADFVTLRLRTDDGIEGIAYAGFASKLVTRALKELLDALASETVGADPHAVGGDRARAAPRGGRRFAGGPGDPRRLGDRRGALGHQGQGAGDAGVEAPGRGIGRLAHVRERLPVAAPSIWTSSPQRRRHSSAKGFRAMKLRMGVRGDRQGRTGASADGGARLSAIVSS